MNKYKIIILIILILFSFNTYSQVRQNYFMLHSAGYEFDNDNISLYLNLKKRISSKFFLGLGAGIVDNHKSAKDAVYDFLLPIYPSLQAGSYVMDIQFNTFGMAWIINASADYNLFQNFYAGIGAGVIANKKDTYLTNYYFGKSSQNEPLIVENAGNVYDNPCIVLMIRGYFRIDFNYNYKSIITGIYGDNLYSTGVNFGIGF